MWYLFEFGNFVVVRKIYEDDWDNEEIVNDGIGGGREERRVNVNYYNEEDCKELIL